MRSKLLTIHRWFRFSSIGCSGSNERSGDVCGRTGFLHELGGSFLLAIVGHLALGGNEDIVISFTGQVVLRHSQDVVSWQAIDVFVEILIIELQ